MRSCCYLILLLILVVFITAIAYHGFAILSMIVDFEKTKAFIAAKKAAALAEGAPIIETLNDGKLLQDLEFDKTMNVIKYDLEGEDVYGINDPAGGLSDEETSLNMCDRAGLNGGSGYIPETWAKKRKAMEYARMLSHLEENVICGEPARYNQAMYDIFSESWHGYHMEEIGALSRLGEWASTDPTTIPLMASALAAVPDSLYTVNAWLGKIPLIHPHGNTPRFQEMRNTYTDLTSTSGLLDERASTMTPVQRNERHSEIMRKGVVALLVTMFRQSTPECVSFQTKLVIQPNFHFTVIRLCQWVDSDDDNKGPQFRSLQDDSLELLSYLMKFNQAPSVAAKHISIEGLRRMSHRSKKATGFVRTIASALPKKQPQLS
eukprot:TRINITY_DN990_c0_g1_i3.p1 TRINITY_DN990_c0_g1~~TRINITY_DN990_c0_g1_i3.p1  ORF type:complete len:377 (-),score=59.49 TRINITY_DN990_c0_g1_i3:191-1321(-)